MELHTSNEESKKINTGDHPEENENPQELNADLFYDRRPFKRHGNRKRSKSHHFLPMFGDKIYQRVEAYLDEEGLYVASTSPISQPKRINQCNIKPVLLLNSCHSTEEHNRDSETTKKFAKPLFLVKRIQSMETPSVSPHVKEVNVPSRFKSKTVLPTDDD